MKPYILLFLFLFGGVASAFSQKVLVLDLAGMRSKRIHYNSGDYIYVKVFNDKVTYKGYLEVVSDTAFYVDNNLVILDSLSAIIKHNKAPKAISKQAFLVAGITAIVVGLNNGLTKGTVFPNDDSWIVPGVFAGIGTVLLPFWKKTYKINNKNRIVKILDLTPVAPPIESEP